MTAILTILGFWILYLLAKRLVAIKQDSQMGFHMPKKSIWQKLFGK